MARYAQITVLGFSDNLPYEKVGKNEPICIADEVPFDIPESWEWVRLGNIGDWGSGATPNRTTPEYYNGNIPWLKTGDLNDNYITDIPETITELALAKTSVRLNPIGSVLIAMYGATIGKLGILKIPATTNQACCACVPFTDIYNEFLFYFLMSQKVAFVKRGEGGAQPNISKEKIVSTLMPLPPVAEQKRIVEKLRILQPYIDYYAVLEKSDIKLTQSFPEKLKKSILQYAVQGKLVPQDPADEPASALLERIRAEKEQLIKEGKIKRDKHESVIFRRDNSYYEKVDGIERCIDDELPFEIPENWEWVRLSSISKILNGDRGKNYPSKATLSSTGIPFISALNLDGTTIIQDENLLCMTEEQYNRLGNGKLIKNDIVVCIRGSLGKHGRYPFEKGAIASSLAILRPYDLTESIGDYIMLWLDSPAFFEQIRKHDNGTAQPNLAAKNLEQFLIPLPPYGEQHRLIAKAEMFFSKLKTL